MFYVINIIYYMFSILFNVQGIILSFRIFLIEETEVEFLRPRSGYFPRSHRPYQHHLQRLGILARSEPGSVELVSLSLPSSF